jgi:hypothetical protein
LSEVFFPLGFPVQVSTNRVEALEIARKSWSQFQRMSTREPLVIELEFVSSEERQEAVEAPCTSVEGELLTVAFDKHGAVVADLEQGHARGTLDEAVLAAELNLRYYVLEAIALSMISTLRAVALHAACVAWKKAGVLICGESGAGKTTLAYACARSGWKYISDDASYLLLEGQGRRVIGNCHQIRFRDTAAVLFTELSGRGTTSRVAGKPSIEVCTSELHGVQQADYAVIQFIIFLNRRSESIPGLYPIERWRGQEYFARFLLVPAHQYSRAKQALEGLLGAQMFELRYTDLDWAVRFLSRAIEEGDICTTG